jgi:hypothetical protein
MICKFAYWFWPWHHWGGMPVGVCLRGDSDVKRCVACGEVKPR